MARHLRTPLGPFRWVVLVVFTGLLLWLAIAGAPSSSASAKAIDLPGIEICPKNAPFATTPESGLAGLLGERPLQITTDNTPQHIWTTGGFSGMRARTYDLGCAIDPTSWSRVTSANADSGVSNAFLSIGDGVVSLTDSIDRRAWEPGWTLSFLDGFARHVSSLVGTILLLPYLGLALLLATILLLWRSHRGDMSGAATNVGWIFVVMTITSLILISPVMIAKAGQGVGSQAVALMNGGPNASDAATNQIVYNVEYQGFLRRNFGSAESEVGKKYGPDLLAAARVSWAEMDAIAALPEGQRSDAREKLTKAKEKDFKEIAEKVKDADPTAYRYLTGAQFGSFETIIELLFIGASCFFRLAAAVLMVTCAISLAVLAVIWLVLTPLIVLPAIGRHTGRDMGIGLINNAVTAIKYVLMAAAGSWLFGLYAQAAMAPGIGVAWSLLLLIIGTVLAWTAIRPDRKFLSILSLGRVNGYGYIGRLVKTLAAAYVGGWAAGATVNRHNDEREEQQQEPERLSENVSSPRIVQADIFHPAQPFRPETATHVDGEPIMGSIVNALPSGLPLYERSTPEPPADTAASPYVPYERADDNEGAQP
jgi:hypothetical protein